MTSTTTYVANQLKRYANKARCAKKRKEKDDEVVILTQQVTVKDDELETKDNTIAALENDVEKITAKFVKCKNSWEEKGRSDAAKISSLEAQIVSLKACRRHRHRAHEHAMTTTDNRRNGSNDPDNAATLVEAAAAMKRSSHLLQSHRQNQPPLPKTEYSPPNSDSSNNNNNNENDSDYEVNEGLRKLYGKIDELIEDKSLENALQQLKNTTASNSCARRGVAEELRKLSEETDKLIEDESSQKLSQQAGEKFSSNDNCYSHNNNHSSSNDTGVDGGGGCDDDSYTNNNSNSCRSESDSNSTINGNSNSSNNNNSNNKEYEIVVETAVEPEYKKVVNADAIDLFPEKEIGPRASPSSSSSLASSSSSKATSSMNLSSFDEGEGGGVPYVGSGGEEEQSEKIYYSVVIHTQELGLIIDPNTGIIQDVTNEEYLSAKSISASEIIIHGDKVVQIGNTQLFDGNTAVYVPNIIANNTQRPITIVIERDLTMYRFVAFNNRGIDNDDMDHRFNRSDVGMDNNDDDTILLPTAE